MGGAESKRLELVFYLSQKVGTKTKRERGSLTGCLRNHQLARTPILAELLRHRWRMLAGMQVALESTWRQNCSTWAAQHSVTDQNY